jgi:YidC/Oxa1 family membrane protein insertase
VEIQRLILFLVFSFSLFLLWEAWQKEQNSTTLHSGNVAQKGAQPGIPTPSALSPPVRKPPENEGSAKPQAEKPLAPIKVATDALRAEISRVGGDITYLELLGHRDTVDQTKNLVLLGSEHKYWAQSGLIGDGMPNHKTAYSTSTTQVVLEDGKDSVSIRLEAEGTGDAAGVKVTKILTFRRDSYLIEITHEIKNSSPRSLSTNAYYQLTRDGKSPAGDSKMVSTYTGPAVYSDQDKFQKIAFSDIDKNKAAYAKAANNGWIGILQHYFVAALLPQDQRPREYYARKLMEDFYAAGAILPVDAITPGSTGMITVALYAGPQEQEKLKAIATGLELTVDYGWLTVIAAPLFWVLQYFHGWVGNWGLAIILLTVVIKLIFFPLSAASYRSMAKMKLVTPKMMKIREQYANDRMKQNQAMMDLYKQEKINPLGGCLPILVQIPVFISLYWVLLASVELRHAPWLWVPDLATPDTMFTIPGIAMPVGVLPIIMMVTMIFQTRMNPTPPDPVQAKVMQIMPFAFGVMFFFFPAGLVLYWVINNILSIAQQWQITRMIEGNKPVASAKR